MSGGRSLARRETCCALPPPRPPGLPGGPTPACPRPASRRSRAGSASSGGRVSVPRPAGCRHSAWRSRCPRSVPVRGRSWTGTGQAGPGAPRPKRDRLRLCRLGTLMLNIWILRSISYSSKKPVSTSLITERVKKTCEGKYMYQ